MIAMAEPRYRVVDKATGEVICRFSDEPSALRYSARLVTLRKRPMVVIETPPRAAALGRMDRKAGRVL